MFEGPGAWLTRWRALRELRQVRKQDNHGYLGFFSDQIDIARVAFDQGLRDKPLQIWREMHTRYPDLSLTSEKAFNLLIDLGCHDEAEMLILEARRRYPRHKPLYAVCFALVAYRRGDLQEANRRCDEARRRFPQVAGGYSIAASCLGDLERYDEAEVMLRVGVHKVPTDFSLHMRYAQAATRRLDWTEALQRWKTLYNRFQATSGLLGQAECLMKMERLDEAENMLNEACEHFHMNPWPFAQLAMLSSSKGNTGEAVRRWEVVLRQFPSFEFAYPKAAEALHAAGQDVEADELLRVGLTRYPSDLELNLEYARSAHRRGDWTAARQRWTLVRDRFPDCKEACEREADAMVAERQRSHPDHQ